MEFLDITTIITIAVAVFVLLRLRSVLGQRTGHQKPPPGFNDRNKKNSDEQDNSIGDNVVTLPRRGGKAEAQEKNPAVVEIDEIAKPRTNLNKGLKEILAIDPVFRPKQFLNGAEMAYEMIVNAFADGDRKTLKNLLSPDVFKGFSSVLAGREKRGETTKSSFVGIDSSTLQGASQKGNESHLTVRFVSQIISSTYDKNDKIIDGDESQIATVTDIWTFSRDTRSGDPNWKLVATESEA